MVLIMFALVALVCQTCSACSRSICPEEDGAVEFDDGLGNKNGAKISAANVS